MRTIYTCTNINTALKLIEHYINAITMRNIYTSTLILTLH